jgi:hypothetical protein
VKTVEWLQRYAPMEVAGSISAVVIGVMTWMLTRHMSAAVWSASIAEGIGYYGYAGVRESRRQSHRNLVKVVGTLLLEFGPGELIDSLLVRPAAMYLAFAVTHQVLTGILVGKVLADIAFYAVTISCYELRKRHSSSRRPNLERTPAI